MISPLLPSKPLITLIVLATLLVALVLFSLGGEDASWFWPFRIDRVLASLLAGGILGLSVFCCRRC